MDVEKLYQVWNFGDADGGIRPFKKLKSKIHLKKGDRSSHSKASKLMSEFPDVPDDITRASAATMATFQQHYTALCITLYGVPQPPNRAKLLSFSTVYDKLRKRKRENADEGDVSADDDSE